MATKRKAPKKAKRPPRAKQRTSDSSPASAAILSPKAAAEWLARDARLFHELIQVASENADRAERRALAWLTYYLGETIDAAARAVASGKPVRLDVDHEASAIESLALVLRALSRIGMDPPDELGVLGPAIHAITTRIARIARELAAEDSTRRDVEWAKRDAEREADPAWRPYADAWDRFRAAGDQAVAAGRAAQGDAS